MRIRMTVVAMLLFSSWLTQAAEDVTNRVVGLGEILVVGRSVKRDLIAAPTLESASLEIATSVVDEEDIRRGNAANLTDALNLSSGVFTERRGRKEKALSSFRGQIYPYPDFAINGIWQRSFWEVPSFFPASAIGRVEVLRSSGAIMVGPNSGLVGAVNVVPRRFESETTLFEFQGGSYNSYRGSILRGDRADKGDYTVGASYYSVDGPSGANAGEQFGSLFGAGEWRPYEPLKIEFTAFALRGERELRLIEEPGQKSLQNRKEKYSPYTSYGGVMRALLGHDDEASTELDLGWFHRHGHYRREITGKPDVESYERDWEYNVGLIHARRLSENNVARAGLQYNHWVCPDGKRFFVGNRMDVHTFSGVVADEHQFGALILDAGLRTTRAWYSDYSERAFTITGESLAGRKIEDEWSSPSVVGTLGAKYALAEPIILYARAAAGTVDAPTGAVAESEEALDREARFLLDGGLELELEGLGGLKLGGFAVFRNDASLLTQSKVTEEDEVFNLYANGDARQYGLEFEARSVPLFEALSVYCNVTAMNSEKSIEGDWERHHEIPRVIAKAGLQSTFDRLDLNLFAQYASKYENRRFAEDGLYHDLGDYIDLNLNAGIRLGSERRTRLFLSLENLLNDKYSTVVGYPDYGFRAYGGIQYEM